MAVDPATYYGDINDADAYFANRLHETDWAIATGTRQEQAVLAATRDIDSLVFSGYKTAVFNLLESNPDATQEEIDAADATQPLEFPRDGSDEIPEDIQIATWEIAHSRLKGLDPDIEYCNLFLTNYGSGSTRISKDTSGMPAQHLANGIVSWIAWKYLKPYLDSGYSFGFLRV